MFENVKKRKSKIQIYKFYEYLILLSLRTDCFCYYFVTSKISIADVILNSYIFLPHAKAYVNKCFLE
ncbi:hypothetical protein [Borreliella valaisiana]|uniref:hypothetical protein n=1 Tax=Borreliella valaisiana TaxID=62088 RepID=UPI002ED6B20E|nr:hypothetical protein KJD09_04395 [Borreliella valaisiana]